MTEKTPNQSPVKNWWRDLKVGKEYDSVAKPAHYANRKFEVIDVMKDTMSPEQFAGYALGCTLKYLNRWDKKANPVEDLKKAKWYLDKLIETVEGEK